MRASHGIGIALVTATLLAAPGAGHAADPPKQSADAPVDEGLLEFLGSADPSSDSTQADDGSWLEYLSRVNIGRRAQASPAPQGPQQRKPGSAAGSEKPSG